MLQYLLTLQDVEVMQLCIRSTPICQTNKMEIVRDEIVRAIVKNRELRMSNIPLQERISYTTDLLQVNVPTLFTFLVLLRN